MSKIDEAIYVARPDLIGLEKKKVNFDDLNEALGDEASTATAITILGGYYNQEALVSLCLKVPPRPAEHRRTCRIRIVVGLEAMSLLPRVWTDLRQVDKRLRGKGFQDIEVKIVPRDPVHFHTKVFGFIHKTHPVWYVGSANPGSERHELMLRLSGRHDALSAYVEAAHNGALPVTAGQPPKIEITTLQGFLLGGVLCHRPPTQRLFTFDAFRFSTSEREQLDQALGQNGEVLHARPRTEGYGFGLASALELEHVQTGAGRARSVRLRESCIYTVLGLWMPLKYATELRTSFTAEEKAREQRLEAFSEKLESATGMKTARSAFKDHIASMTDFLTRHQIDVHPIPSHEKLFNRFLASRSRTLRTKESRQRHSRMVTLTEMPDIWEDSRAANEFEASFFEDLAYRAGILGGNKGRVVRSITEALCRYGSPETDDEIREALKQKLGSDAWTDEDWVSVHETQ